MEPMSEMDDPPVTGNGIVDEALQKVADLVDVPLEDHPEVLKQAQNALQEFLNTNDAV